VAATPSAVTVIGEGQCNAIRALDAQAMPGCSAAVDLRWWHMVPSLAPRGSCHGHQVTFRSGWLPSLPFPLTPIVASSLLHVERWCHPASATGESLS
jgi:hypothetical protein